MLGIDKGTTYTKTNRELCIRSTIRKYRETDINLDNDKIILEMGEQKYIVGEKGNYSTDLMKSQHLNTKLLILLSIGLSHPKDEVIFENIVTGLPIGQYSSQKAAMKEMFLDSRHEIKINGRYKIIHIGRVEVFPEAAGAFFSQSEYTDALIIDIGGLSVDIALFRNKKLKQYSTYAMGVMKLYSKIANRINALYDLSKNEWDIEELINDGLYVYGEKVDMGVDELALEHTKEIIERLSLEYDLKTIRNVLLTGGAANWLQKYFMLDIPQAKVLPHSQFTNAIGYYNIGKVLWG